MLLNGKGVLSLSSRTYCSRSLAAVQFQAWQMPDREKYNDKIYVSDFMHKIL